MEVTYKLLKHNRHAISSWCYWCVCYARVAGIAAAVIVGGKPRKSL